jgi:murein DD-endopeptidase MepM/ murein hydrolase activator NlpD
MNWARASSKLALLLSLATAFSQGWSVAQTTNQNSAVTLTPAVVEAGSPELIHVSAPNAREVSGEWLGRKVEFFESADKQSWYALAGSDVEDPVGPSTLKIDINRDGISSHQELPVEIHPAHYRTETISVAPRYVEPNTAQLKQIEAAIELKQQAFAASASKPLWHGDFRAPVVSRATDSFGVRRTYNGKLAGIHEGMDFRARTGTVVRAANSGVVVLAHRLYYEGNCVIIDHGLGLYTVSMHLSRVNVHRGEHVVKGQRLGLSGATGRVTGAHLHWAVRWQGIYLDPAKVLKLDLKGIR